MNNVPIGILHLTNMDRLLVLTGLGIILVSNPNTSITTSVAETVLYSSCSCGVSYTEWNWLKY